MCCSFRPSTVLCVAPPKKREPILWGIMAHCLIPEMMVLRYPPKPKTSKKTKVDVSDRCALRYPNAWFAPFRRRQCGHHVGDLNIKFRVRAVRKLERCRGSVLAQVLILKRGAPHTDDGYRRQCYAVVPTPIRAESPDYIIELSCRAS